MMDSLHNYKILTLTHKHTPLHELGQFVLTAATQNDATNEALQIRLQSIKHAFGMRELLYLATCNRILFVFVQDEPLSEEWVTTFLQTVYPALSAETLATGVRTAQLHEGEQAIQHLFEVASSIDSLVVGEREILRQLRTAYDTQVSYGTTGDCIRLAMRFTVEAAKKVYSNTAIGEKPVSVVSLAMQQLFSHHIPKNARYLIVGAGQTNQLVAKFLVKHDVQHVAVFNRTLGKAQQLAETLHGQAYTLDQLHTYTGGFDVLIACTGATEAVVTPAIYEQLLQGDTKKKVLVDLSIPNNIDNAILQQHDADYIEIEHLKALAKENLAFREQEIHKAKSLLETDVQIFAEIFQARQIERALSDVPVQIKAVKDHALNNLFKSDVDSLDDSSRAVLDKVLSYLEKRYIAIPLQVAKENLVGKI